MAWAALASSKGKALPQAPRLPAVPPPVAHQVEVLRLVAAPVAATVAAVAAAVAEPVEETVEMATVTAAAMAAATVAAAVPLAPFLPPNVVADPARLVAMETPTETTGAHRHQVLMMMMGPRRRRPGNWES